VYWDMERDVFYPGQWLKGRIYERRCDLSPSGKRLVYLAASQKPPYHSWTAVSRPPYLTAVVFWPNMGTWGGGGLFQTENRLSLNHSSGYREPAKETRVPRELSVSPLGTCAGGGEDSPIMDIRLKRDGWALLQQGTMIEHRRGAPLGYEYDPPRTWSRRGPRGKHCWQLRMIERGFHERGGAWNVVEYELFNPATRRQSSLGRLDWADWRHSGDLVFTKDGCVWSLALQRLECAHPLEEAQQLADLRPLSFREMPPPLVYDWSADVPLPPPLGAE